MIKTPTRAVRSNQNLLQALLDVPSLPAYIQQMPAVALCRLIAQIGLEDSEALLAIIGPEQMREVLSVSLWRSAAPGKTEALDIEKFIDWVQGWLLGGEEATARRLLEMEEDLLVSLVISLLLVRTWDDEELPDEVELIFDEYRIYRRSEIHWPVIEEMLLALWQYQPDFTLRLLMRCDREQAVAGQSLSGIVNRSALYEDVAFEREVRRAEAGYVDPLHACAFLASARSRSLAELRDQRAYDHGTTEYFSGQARNLKRLNGPMSRSALETASTYQIADGGNAAKRDNHETAYTNVATPVEILKEFEVLDAMLLDAGIMSSSARAHTLLAAPDSQAGASDSSVPTLLERAFVQFAWDAPVTSSRRLSELAYLSNVVMMDMQVQSRSLSESDAAKFTVATANLGACWLLDNNLDFDDPLSGVRRMLENEPGIVRLFQIGYHLLCDIPEQCAQALEHALPFYPHDSTDFTRDETDGSLSTETLASLIRQKQYEVARSRIDDLVVVMDNAACIALKTFIDSTPCFPYLLDPCDGVPPIYVNKRSRYISTLTDLHRITEFLGRLPNLSRD